MAVARFGSVVLVGLALLATACGPAVPVVNIQATAAPQVAATVAAKGFGQWSNLTGYGVVVENPGSQSVTGLRYEVRMFDADNVLQDSETGTVPPVSSGGRMGVAGVFSVKATITQMQVSLTGGRSTSDVAIPQVVAEEAHYVAFGQIPGHGEIVGTLRNTGATDARDLNVAAIALDDQGQVVTGDSHSVALVPAGGRAAFRLQVYTSPGETATITHAELFPTPLW